MKADIVKQETETIVSSKVSSIKSFSGLIQAMVLMLMMMILINDNLISDNDD